MSHNAAQAIRVLSVNDQRAMHSIAGNLLHLKFFERIAKTGDEKEALQLLCDQKNI